MPKGKSVFGLRLRVRIACRTFQMYINFAVFCSDFGYPFRRSVRGGILAPFWSLFGPETAPMDLKKRSRKHDRNLTREQARRDANFWAARRNARASWGIIGGDKDRPKIESLEIAGTLVHRPCNFGQIGDWRLAV